ncbi:MAG: hypothetical protein L6R41_004995 [Letrouitia leprolyta]|nr:MAG: hypothetical protein L6R41_004995 [Letrouitia leprolyta]
MPPILLPASAAAFAPRSAPNIVLNSKVERWLTETLKRVSKVKRPLNSVPQHHRCLTETLSSPLAIWTLCSLMLPKAPESELRKDDNPLVEALFNYQMVTIEAYVVHVDMVSQNEVAFKLTSETIETLVEYHKDIHSVDTAAATWNWSEKEVQLKKLQEDFVQAANRFVYRTNSKALEGMEEDGAGELLCGRSEEVRSAIMGLFLPLLPPPPRVVDVVRPTPLLPSSTDGESWWHPSVPQSQHSSMDSWRVVSSNSNATSGDSTSSMWASLSMDEMQLPSPSSSFSETYTTECDSPPPYYSAPMTTAPYTASMTCAPIPQLPLPSTLLQQQCSTSMGYGGFDWGRYQDFTLPFAM